MKNKLNLMNFTKIILLFTLTTILVNAAVPSEATRDTIKGYIGQEINNLDSFNLEYNTNNYIVFIPKDLEQRQLSAVINLDTGNPADYNSSIQLTKTAFKISSFKSKSVSSSATVNDLGIYFDDINNKVKKLKANYQATIREITLIKDLDLSTIENDIQNIIDETTVFQDDLQELTTNWNEFDNNPSKQSFDTLIQSYNQTAKQVQKLNKVGSTNEADLRDERNQVINDKNLSIEDKNNINAGLQTLSFEESLKSLTILNQRMSLALSDYNDEKKINSWASDAVDNYDFIRIKKDLNTLQITFAGTITELKQNKNAAYSCGLKKTYDDTLTAALASLDKSSKILETPLIKTMRKEYDELNNDLTTTTLKLNSFKNCSTTQVVPDQPTSNWPLIIGIIVVLVIVFLIYRATKPKQEEAVE